MPVTGRVPWRVYVEMWKEEVQEKFLWLGAVGPRSSMLALRLRTSRVSGELVGVGSPP